MKHTGITLLTAFLWVLPASAGVIYSNGPANGTIDTRSMSGGYAITDSFVVSTATVATGADFAAVTYQGSVPLTVDWAIGWTAFGTDLGSGTGATLSNSGLTTATYFGDSYDLQTSTFSFGGVRLAAGTYWLTLQNGTSTSHDFRINWDVNNGASSAQQTTVGSISSEAFEVLNSAPSAPEPGTIALMVAGLGVIVYRRRL